MEVKTTSSLICDSLMFDAGDVIPVQDAGMLQFSGSTWGTGHYMRDSDRDSMTGSPTSTLSGSGLSPGSVSSQYCVPSPEHLQFLQHPQQQQQQHQQVSFAEDHPQFDFSAHFDSYPALCDAVAGGSTSQDSLDSEGSTPYSSDPDSSPLGGSRTQHFWNNKTSTPVKSEKPKRKRVLNGVQRSEASVRERRRMVTFNGAFDALKKRIPGYATEKKKMSRIDTLRCAIDYIAFLSNSLEMY